MIKKFFNYLISNLILLNYAIFCRLYKLFIIDKELSINKFEIIIFSFDRPLQIKSLLDSILIYIDKEIKVNIFYKCSDDSFKKSYNQIINNYERYNSRFKFIEQKGNFKNDFVSLINKLDVGINKHFLFFVDDQIIFRDINLKKLDNLFKNSFIATFRLGLNTNWSYNLNKSQSLSSYKKEISKNYVTWTPKLIREDISYPLSLDATTIPSVLIKMFANFLFYKGPNTFESSMNYGLFIFYFLKLKITSPIKQAVVNIVISLVNKECINRGTFINIKTLQKYYEDGWNLSLDKEKINEICSPHIDKYIYLIKKDQIKKL